MAYLRIATRTLPTLLKICFCFARDFYDIYENKRDNFDITVLINVDCVIVHYVLLETLVQLDIG